MLSLSSRRCGKLLAIGTAAGTDQLVSFGPFLPGEMVDSFTVFLMGRDAMTAITGNYVTVDFAVSARPLTVNTQFTGQAGRLLTESPQLPIGCTGPDGTLANTQQSLGPALVLPICWVATDKERFITLRLQDSSGLGVRGSIWLRMGEVQDRLEVEPILVEEED